VGTFATGAIVLVKFPFSDLSESKLRPAVVLANGLIFSEIGRLRPAALGRIVTEIINLLPKFEENS
jgi:hypothetical protein